MWRMLSTMRNLVLSTCTSWYLIKLGGDLRTYYNADVCDMRVDTCDCMARPLSAATALRTLGYAQAFVSVSELSAFYLHLPYRSFTLGTTILRFGAYRVPVPIPSFSIWSVSRHIFYVTSLLVGWLGILVLVGSFTWLFIGFVVDPAPVAPLLLTIACVIVTASRYYLKLLRRRVAAANRLRRVVEDKLSQLQRSQSLVPQSGLDAILHGKMDLQLHRYGLSFVKIWGKVVGLVLLLAATLAFLYIGFQVYSTATNPIASVVNCFLVLSVASAFSQVTRGVVASEAEEEARLDQIAQDADREVQRLFDSLELQLQTAARFLEMLEGKPSFEVFQEQDDT
mmetsp:Transcript_46770/g.124232  ORF Transcript_46770/g.124232 Transcript_46770/m.124232 type:complete len:339 (-) Transcript_46770:625-1641(-)